MTVEVAIGQELFSAVGVVVTDSGFTEVAKHQWLLSPVAVIICLSDYVCFSASVFV